MTTVHYTYTARTWSYTFIPIANVRTTALAAKPSCVVGAHGIRTARLVASSGARIRRATVATCTKRQCHCPLELVYLRPAILVLRQKSRIRAMREAFHHRVHRLLVAFM